MSFSRLRQVLGETDGSRSQDAHAARAATDDARMPVVDVDGLTFTTRPGQPQRSGISVCSESRQLRTDSSPREVT